jgi:hypothetical protein
VGTCVLFPTFPDTLTLVVKTTSLKMLEAAMPATYVSFIAFSTACYTPMCDRSLQSEKYVVHENSLSSLVFETHASFMMAEPPGDLHRRNVLRNGVTHVGIGLYYSDKHFRLVEVFAARYIELLDKSPDGTDIAPGFRLTTDETYIYAKVCLAVFEWASFVKWSWDLTWAGCSAMFPATASSRALCSMSRTRRPCPFKTLMVSRCMKMAVRIVWQW